MTFHKVLHMKLQCMWFLSFRRFLLENCSFKDNSSSGQSDETGDFIEKLQLAKHKNAKLLWKTVIIPNQICLYLNKKNVPRASDITLLSEHKKTQNQKKRLRNFTYTYHILY